MFTALVITKQLLKAFYAVGLKKESLYGVGKESKRISFLSKKNIFFAVSVVVIVAGFVVMGINQGTKGSALNYSLEFVGGTSTNVTFNEDRTIEDIDSSIVPLIEAITGDGNVQTQKVAGTNEVIFKTRHPAGPEDFPPDRCCGRGEDLLERHAGGDAGGKCGGETLWRGRGSREDGRGRAVLL